MWNFKGHQRPAFATVPGPGQESVWDYPRPPVAVRDGRQVEVRDGDVLIARSSSTWRVLETASPPTFYIPASDVATDLLVRAAGRSLCEWKGVASYWALARQPGQAIAWSYARPSAAFAAIEDCLAFYPGRVACFVDGERVRPQPGHFYGGWITAEIVGPVKGEPGTGHW